MHSHTWPKGGCARGCVLGLKVVDTVYGTKDMPYEYTIWFM